MIDSPTLLESLRHATLNQHQALHVHPLLAPLQDDTISMEDYRWIIRAFHQLYASVEKQPYSTFGMPDVPAVTWLERDMQVHDITPAEPAPINYPALTNPSQLLGYLYVKQGSTLGGRVISKHLHKTLGLIDHETNYFFAGFGEETGPRWKAFLKLLENKEVNHEEAVNQAIKTFKATIDCCDTMQAEKQTASTIA